MISKICKFLSDLINRLSPVKLKTWFYDEFLPLFVVSVFALFQSAFIYQPLLLTYMCWKWRGWIWFALGYQLWIQYDSKILKTAGRKWVTCLSLIFSFVKITFALAVSFSEKHSRVPDNALPLGPWRKY